MDKDREKELLSEFAKMLNDDEKDEKEKIDPDKCNHDWVEVPGFYWHTRYTVCSKCKVDKEHWESKRKKPEKSWF